MLTTKCEITVYEVDGEEVTPVGGPTVVVRSRDKHRILVELDFDGKRVSVNRRDLEAALRAIGVEGA
jgi:hypothetical protein